MATVTVSPKFQVVIPKSIREKIEVKVGQKFHLIPFVDRIEFIPVKNVKEMRGFLKGIDTDIPREINRV